MKYNGCPDSEVLAEYFKKWKYDPKRKEEVLNKLHSQYGNYLNTAATNAAATDIQQINEKCDELSKKSWRKSMKNKKLLGYLGGDIMSFGSNLAREYEYEKFKEANIPGEVYSPVQNKSINDKSNMTEEENNCLAEKIVAADVDRLWNSDYTVMCPEQSAIGTMCEMGILYGWQYMTQQLYKIVDSVFNNDELRKALIADGKHEWEIQEYLNSRVGILLTKELKRIANQKNYAHYFDIRTNHLNEKDWRRSFSINQFLYGIILAATADGTLHNSFDEILPILKEQFKNE